MVSRNRKTLTLGLILVHVATSVTALLGPVELTAQADTTPLVSNATTGYTPFTFTGTPVSFQTAQAQSFSNLYGTCFQGGTNDQTNQLVNSIVQLTTTKTANSTGKAGSDPSCSVAQSDTCSMAVSNGNPSCPVDRRQDEVTRYFNSLIGVAQNADCCAKSKMSKLDEANKELTCINQQNSLLAQQIKSIQTDIQSKFQQAQKDVANLDTIIGERVQQTEFIQSKLGGDKSNGTRGLLALQADMQKVVTGELPAKVKTFEDTITSYNQQQQIFQQRVANQKMALAKQCFTSSDSRYQCSVNSTSTCSFAELMEAKYYELMRSVNGKIQRTNKTNQAQAQSKKAALDALFQTIFANMASDTKLVATTQQEAQTQQQTSGDIYQIKSPQDLQNLYGSQLAAFNLPGLNIQQLFLNKFEQCYEQGQSSVTSAQSDPTSQYSLSVTFMQKQNKDIRDGFIQFYKGYADMYAQFWSTMGQTAPLDTSKCEASSTPLAGMLQCAKDLQTNLEGAYTGKTANSAVTISVPGSSTMPGSNPPTAGTKFNFTCNGVNGCVTVMQNLATNLKTETQNQDKAKKNYIQNANQQLDQYKQQLTNILSIQNQALDQRLSQLKSKLPALGVTDPLQVQRVQKVAMTKSKTKDAAGNEYDGLYNTPDDILGVVGGDMSPALIDPNSSTFDSARSSIAQAIQNAKEKASESTRMMAELNNLEQSCLKKMKEDAVRMADSYIDNYSNQCLPDICVNKKKDLNDFIKTVSQATGEDLGADLKEDVDARLNGLTRQCDKISSRTGNASDDLVLACSQLSSCRASDVAAVISKCPNRDSINFAAASNDAQTPVCAGNIRAVIDSASKARSIASDSDSSSIACSGLAGKASKALSRATGSSSDDSSDGVAN